MKHLGLFAGIGGFELAARWMGWETVAWCEWNKWCQDLLKRRFPNAEGFGDITKSDFKKYARKIDVLTGGDPCQPHSTRGKRLGEYDDRYLWPEMCYGDPDGDNIIIAVDDTEDDAKEACKRLNAILDPLQSRIKELEAEIERLNKVNVQSIEEMCKWQDKYNAAQNEIAELNGSY